MSEETKKEKPEETSVSKEVPKENIKPSGPDAQSAETKKEQPPKKVKPANCEACNKSIKVKWYYRNGGYYCTKRCFKTDEKKKKAKESKEATS